MNRWSALLVAGFLASGPTLAAAPTRALPHVHPDWATAENDQGAVDPDLWLTNLTIVLDRPPERQRAFEALLREQQDPRSANFHRWLTPAEIGRQFGLADADIAMVTSWLRSRGLEVDAVAGSRVRVEFSGAAANVAAAFGTSLHAYLVDGERMISPASTPQIPSSFAALVKSVHGLQSVRERPHHRVALSQPVATSGERPKATFCSGTACNHSVAPSDFATIYDVNSVYQQGINGAGQTIAIIGRARVHLPDIENFERFTGLANKDPVIIVPPNGLDPGPAASTNDGQKHSDQGEATLDVTRAGSVAPGATIDLVISADPPTSSGLAIATEYVVDGNLAQVISISFGACEQNRGQAGVSYWDSLFSQAVAQGISIFVSSGDAGASGCNKNSAAPPGTAIVSPNYICSSSYATCVGGTEFVDTANPGAYWNPANTATRGSALGYIPEGAWNEPLNGSGTPQFAASGGGVSLFVATPSWQVGPGVPGIQGRYTPDVSFTAASHDGYLACFAASGSCVQNASGGFSWSVFSGTSASAPSMAGVAALLNQKMGRAQGNLNPRLYALAMNSGNGVFHDVTVATSGVGACDPSLASMCNNSVPGATDLTGGLAGYAVGPGYDMVTGLGSIHVANLMASWSDAAPPPAGQLQLPSPYTFANQTAGTQSTPAILTVTNTGGAAVTISNVTGTDNTHFPATSTCFTTLQPNGQCTITVSFAPSVVGPASEVVTVTSNGAGSPQSFGVSGIGVSASTVSYEGLWLNANESGWGLNLTHQGTILFGTWFTYDSDGSGMWLVMSNGEQTSPGHYSGALYRTTGPAFNSVPFTSIAFPANYTQVGTLTLSFTDANNGTMSYTVNGVTQSKPIFRYVYATGGTACALGGAQGASPNYQDLWLHSPVGTESGWGVNLTHQGDILFATWFTYLAGPTQANKGLWLVMSNGNKIAPGMYSGALQTTTGPAFSSVPFNPGAVTRTTVGTATFTFTDANNGSFSYTVNGITQTKAITRYIYTTPTTVCQ